MAYDGPLPPAVATPLTGAEIAIVYQNGVPKSATVAELSTANGTTGTGVFVLQNNPVINTPTINNPSIVPAASIFNSNGAASIYLNSQSNNGQPVHGAYGMAQFVAQGWDGANYSYDGALYFRAVDNFTPTAHGTELLFFTTPSGTTASVQGAGVYANGSLWSGGTGVLAPTATGPYFGLPSTAGVPTAVPVAPYGSSMVTYDTTDNLLYVYNGAWRSCVTTGGPLGTPSSGNLANCTGLPTAGLAGPFTGAGAIVLQNNPTITGTLTTAAISASGAITSGGALTATGNASAAALLPTGATVPSVGIYLPAANTLGFATGGAGRWFINPTSVLTNLNATLPIANTQGLIVKGASSVSSGLASGFNSAGTAGNGVNIFGSTTDGGNSQIQTAYAVTDGPLRIGTQTTPASTVIGVNGLVTHNNGLNVQAGGLQIAGSAISTANLSDRDSAATGFTPTLSVPTMGDGVFSATTFACTYRRLGFLVWFSINVRFTFTYTTASGQLVIGGFPLTPSGGPTYCPYYVTPIPASPTDHLLGYLSSAGLLGVVTGNNYIGNFWGAGAAAQLNLVSGQSYTIYAGGVYTTNA